MKLGVLTFQYIGIDLFLERLFYLGIIFLSWRLLKWAVIVKLSFSVKNLNLRYLDIRKKCNFNSTSQNL